MDRNNIQEILKKIKTGQNGVGVVGNDSAMAINALSKSVPIAWFEQFANLMIEDMANKFDERGKYSDGTWRDGWYNPNEPGEILRSMKIKEEING